MYCPNCQIHTLYLTAEGEIHCLTCARTLGTVSLPPRREGLRCDNPDCKELARQLFTCADPMDGKRMRVCSHCAERWGDIWERRSAKNAAPLAVATTEQAGAGIVSAGREVVASELAVHRQAVRAWKAARAIRVAERASARRAIGAAVPMAFSDAMAGVATPSGISYATSGKEVEASA